MATNTIAPRAFAVWWKDFDRWRVKCLLARFYKQMARSANCTTRRHCYSERSEIRIRDDETSFDGKVRASWTRISFDEVEGDLLGKRIKTRMAQFRARPGDLVVSKIDVRKRAIGIVQDGHDVGITIQFSALIPDTAKVDACLSCPDCASFHILFKTV